MKSTMLKPAIIFSFIIILFFATMTAMTSASDTSLALHYLVREPVVKSTNTPVIILLHGVGSNEQDLFSLANRLPENFFVISARAPVQLGTNSFAWYQVDFSTGKPVFNIEQQENSRIILIKFIDQIKEKYAVSGKIYLGGFSQGAIMSYSVGLTRPDLVNGIAIMSGRLLGEIKPLIAPKDKLQALKIFVSHGTNDPVLNIQYARSSVAFLKTLGINPTYKEYPEAHTISNDMLIDLVKWLKGN
jgi:phospholipase/carboxylesterase